MEIEYSHRAAVFFEKLPRDLQERIAEKMRWYAKQSDPMKFAKRLANVLEGEYRFRVGSYRIRFDVKDNTIFVVKIGPRDKIYD